MSRSRTPDGEWWSINIDATGPRLRWRPLAWWQQRDARKLEERQRREAESPPGSAPGKPGIWWFLDVPGEGCLIIFGVAAALMLVAMVLGFLVLPVVVVLIDGLLIVAGATVLFAWRTATRSGWTVIAREDGGQERRWRADGWRAARRSQAQIVKALESGSPVTTPEATEVDLD